MPILACMVPYRLTGSFRNLLLPFAILVSSVGIGQIATPRFDLRIVIDGAEASGKEVKKVAKGYTGLTAKEVIEAEEESLNWLISKGFITAGLAGRDTMGSEVQVVIRPGQRYEWAVLHFPQEQRDLLRRLNARPSAYSGESISPERLASLLKRMLLQYENHGFPFASVSLDSVQIEEGKVQAKIEVQKGPLTRIDSIIIMGDLKLRKTYITNYISIKEGDLYNEGLVREVSARLREIPFVEEFRPSEVFFTEGETKLYLYLNKRKASRFNGIAGFQPDGETGKIVITGDVQLNLLNSLGQGEELDVNWRRLQNNTQDLRARALLPFVLNSPIGVDGALNIYRRDTLFTDVFRQLGLRYLMARGDFLRLFVERQTSSLITTDQYQNNLFPPPYLDRAVTSYGLGAKIAHLDYRPNPTKGFELDMEGAAGNKEIIKNPRLPEIIYRDLTLNSLQLRGVMRGKFYVSPLKRVVFYQGVQGATIRNENLFNNEIYRIGGLKTLRGFDEESIFASTYAISSTEIRYLFERSSYAFLFFDGAWYENASVNRVGAGQDFPYGFGAGFTFATNAGIFSINYALGSQQGNPILIRAAKVHFGFLSLF